MHRDQPMYSAEQFWEERYRQSERVWSGEPNSAVVAETAGLSPGRALDLGCGEGADAIWLAAHGWNVTGVDVSATAVERARLEAQRRSLDAVTGFLRVDLVDWEPDGGSSASAQSKATVQRPTPTSTNPAPCSPPSSPPPPT